MNVNATCAPPSCPICKAPVHDEPTDARPHPDAVVEHRDCLFPNRGARWSLHEPTATLVDHVIAKLREATGGQKLIPPWRTWGESPWRRAQRGVRGIHWALVIEEPGSVPLEQQMAEMDAELRRAEGYRLTEDVVREAVASWNASAEPAGEVDDAPGEPPAFVTEAFERLVAAGRGAIDAFNNVHGPLLPETTPTAIAMPKNVRDSIRRVLTTSPRDWSIAHEDAWIYGIVCGWPEDAIEEVAARHRWSPITVDRLRVLHEEWEDVSPGIAVEANAERKPTPSRLVLAARDLLDALPKCWGDTNGSGGHRTYAHDCDRFAEWIDKADGEAHCDKHVWKWEIEKQFKAHVDYQDQATRLASILSQETAPVPAKPISSDHGRTATDEDVERTWKTFWAGTVAPNGVVDLESVKRELFDYACLLDAVPKVYMHVTGGKVSKPTTLPDVVIAMADDRTTEAAEERVAEVATERARGVDTEAAIEREVEAARMRAAEREERRPSIDGHTEVAMINVFATPGGKPPTGWPEPGETP